MYLSAQVIWWSTVGIFAVGWTIGMFMGRWATRKSMKRRMERIFAEELKNFKQ